MLGLRFGRTVYRAEARACTCIHDGLMEIHVEIENSVGVRPPGICQFAEPVIQFLELLDQHSPSLRFELSRCSCGQPFQMPDDPIKFARVVLCQRRDGQPSLAPTARGDKDISFLSESMEGGTNRSPAHPEALSKIGFNQSTARRQLTAYNELANPLKRRLTNIGVIGQERSCTRIWWCTVHSWVHHVGTFHLMNEPPGKKARLKSSDYTPAGAAISTLD